MKVRVEFVCEAEIEVSNKFLPCKSSLDLPQSMYDDLENAVENALREKHDIIPGGVMKIESDDWLLYDATAW